MNWDFGQHHVNVSEYMTMPTINENKNTISVPKIKLGYVYILNRARRAQQTESVTEWLNESEMENITTKPGL